MNRFFCGVVALGLMMATPVIARECSPEQKLCDELPCPPCPPPGSKVGNESYRADLENFRSRLETARAAGEGDLSSYKRGLAKYREGIDAYRSAN